MYLSVLLFYHIRYSNDCSSVHDEQRSTMEESHERYFKDVICSYDWKSLERGGGIIRSITQMINRLIIKQIHLLMLSLDPRNSLSKTLSLDPHSSLTVPVPLRTFPYISYKRNLYVLLINTLILYERDSQIFSLTCYVIIILLHSLIISYY